MKRGGILHNVCVCKCNVCVQTKPERRRKGAAAADVGWKVVRSPCFEPFTFLEVDLQEI